MYTLGLDIGSSSIKAALVSLDTGQVAAQSKYPELEMAIQSPEPGWAEQAPEYWWKCVVEAIRIVQKNAEVKPASIQAIGLAYQMHGLVALDNKNEPVHPAIIWCDSRAVDIGRQARLQFDEQRILKQSLNLPGNFTASKLRWLQEHRPAAYQRIHQVFLPGDYIALRLTGRASTTISGLSEGIFWDFERNALSEDILHLYNIDPSLIPDRVPSIGFQGELSEAAAQATGLKAGTPLCYRAGDQPNNALSLGVFQAGEAAATGGTSGVIYAVTDRLVFDAQSRVNSFAHVNYQPEQPRIGILMCINGTGIQYNWLRQQLYASGVAYQELESAAATVPIGSDGVSVLPFGNGAERILGDIDLGAHLQGINFNRHGKAHLVRAGLEGIAFAFNYGTELMRSLGVNLSTLKVGNDNLFQSRIFSETIATLTGCQLEIYETTGAIGAAQAAAVGAGVWTSLEEARANLKLVNTYQPKGNAAPYEEAYEQWVQQLKKQLETT